MIVRLYGNTGFNSVDIPDSPDTLAQLFTPIEEYHNVNLIQNDYISYLTVNITHKKARIIDYVVIIDDENTKACYTVETYQELTKDVVRFNLLIDPYNTIGGLGLTSGNLVVAGSANRLTVSIEEDNSKFFTLDEPFKPAEEFIIDFNDINRPENQELYTYLETITIPPRIIERLISTEQPLIIAGHKIIQDAKGYGVVYEGGGSGQDLTIDEITTEAGTVSKVEYGELKIPQLRTLKSSQVKMYKFDGTYQIIDTQTRWWNKDHGNCDYEIPIDGRTVKGDLVKDFRNNGRDSDIINFWEIPAAYQEDTLPSPDYLAYKYDPEKLEPTGTSEDQRGYGGVFIISNKLYKKTININTNNYGNNKVKYKSSMQIKIYNPVSAAETNKELYEVVNPANAPSNSNFAVNCTITADIRPQGAPIFLFDFLNRKSQLSTPIETIRGGQWRNIPLTATGISNQNLIEYQINREADTAKKGAIAQVAIGGALAAIGTVATVLTGGAAAPIAAAGAKMGGAAAAAALPMAVSGVGGYIQASTRQAQQQEELAVQGVSAAASITVGSSEYAREIGLNYFFAMITRYSDLDMVAYDSFLTKYGYNVGNKILSNADFWSRPAFNYVRVNDITIKSQTASLEMLEKVKQQLKAGVRIWHKAPNVEDMASGGNRS